MSDERLEHRRKFLKLIGGTAAAVPLAGLAGCSGGEESAPPAPAASTPPPAEPAPEPAPAAPEPAAEAPASAELVPLNDDDPQAKALAYVSDAGNVDTATQPRYEEGQACANCALYMGGEDAMGPCSIFPGRLVHAEGWCSVYAPKAG
ncbi:MAG: high-potential iron-sulfur protein [Pseudomonadota bacterium]